jgi:hypothetical protein
MSLYVFLTMLGGALEILGFAIVATELVRTQRRELGTAGPFQFLVVAGQRVRRGIRRLLGKTEAHEGSAHLSGKATITGRGSARAGTQSKKVVDRLRVLEENFIRLDNEVTQHRRELDEKIDKASGHLEAQIVAFKASLEQREKKRRKPSQPLPHCSGPALAFSSWG